jgi:hypothetical protein
MTKPAPRPRGRPKGSKNKNTFLSGVTVERICELHKFNPTVFLVNVAAGVDNSEQWTKDDRLRAASKLHDSIHGGKQLPGVLGGTIIDGQCELVFVEDHETFDPPADFDNQGETDIAVQGEAGPKVA